MNNLKEKNKGITLITLVIAVIILIIISSLLVYNAKTGIKLRTLKKMYNDIELLSDKVESHYAKYGALPAEFEYLGNIYFEPEPNDNDMYYVIDLNALDGVSLNYGYDFKNITSEDDTLAYNDVYIINEQSHHIYYVRGIEMDGIVYYTNDSDDEIALKQIISIKLNLIHNNTILNPSELPNVKEVTSENVPIPQGFYYVGGTKDEGIVISDIPNDDLDNSKHGNQFVWVPVNQNQKLMLEVTSNEELKEIIVTQPDGSKSTISANGKIYNDEIPMTKNGIYEVEVKTITSSKTVSKRVSSLYAQDVEFFNNKNDKYLDSNQNLNSVNKYGGFYIARFEAGDGKATSARTSSSSDDTNTLVSQKGAFVYNFVTSDTAKKLSSEMYKANTSITSQLITGSGWDRTLDWIIETAGKTEEEVLVNSSGWGNYINSTGNASTNSGTENINYTTGRNEYWKSNNIYDLAGNTNEWTQEQITYNTYRGGDFHVGGNLYPAKFRDTSITQTVPNNILSFRIEIYINV